MASARKSRAVRGRNLRGETVGLSAKSVVTGRGAGSVSAADVSAAIATREIASRALGVPPMTPRGKEPDPNSPFAKLLALKEQLETNAKERR